MRKIYCDNCKKDITNSITIEEVEVSIGDHTFLNLELCDKCIEKFKNDVKKYQWEE